MYFFPNLELVCCSISSADCCFLTCVQVSQEAGKVVWYSHPLKNFPQFVVIHTVKGFNVVNEADVDIFLEFHCFSYDPIDVGNLISGSFAFPKSSLYVWKFLDHTLLRPSWKDFEHYLASMWNECNCLLVWTVFDISKNLQFLGTGMKTGLFQSCGHSKFFKFYIFSAALLQHHLLGF